MGQGEPARVPTSMACERRFTGQAAIDRETL
jgi:hypothetical protein